MKRILLIATGGTIAGSAAKATDTTGYKAGAIGIQTLIDAVPQMKDYAEVSGEQVVSISSNNVTTEIRLKLANRVNELLADPKVDGVVITHGTDSIEETAYFLGLRAGCQAQSHQVGTDHRGDHRQARRPRGRDAPGDGHLRRRPDEPSRSRSGRGLAQEEGSGRHHHHEQPHRRRA